MDELVDHLLHRHWRILGPTGSLTVGEVESVHAVLHEDAPVKRAFMTSPSRKGFSKRS